MSDGMVACRVLVRTAELRRFFNQFLQGSNRSPIDFELECIRMNKGVARVGQAGKIILADQAIYAFIAAGRIVYPVVRKGSFQPFIGMGPSIVSALYIFNFTVPVKLENIFGGCNLGNTAVSDRIAHLRIRPCTGFMAYNLEIVNLVRMCHQSFICG